MRIISYNCRGVNAIRPCLKSVLDESSTDIICLQETWLTKQDLGSLNSLHNDYIGFGAATVDRCDGPIYGHPPGGVAILWRTDLSPQVETLSFDIDWLCGIKLVADSRIVIILCVYMPCYGNGPDREDLYLANLGTLLSIIEDLRTTSVYIIGDWNADISSSVNSFGALMSNFCDDSGLICSSQLLLPRSSFTYVSDSWNTTSWLDHCVSTQDAHDCISDMSILYNLSGDDHIPVLMEISWSGVPATSTLNNDPFVDKIDWTRLTSENIQSYTDLTDSLLSELNTNSDCLSCHDPSCSDNTHIEYLTTLYDYIVKALKSASQQVFDRVTSGTFRCQPGWSDYVSDYYDASREAFLLWASNGKPRQGDLFESMKMTKARFKYALRFIKRNENSLRRDAIARKFASKDPRSFWKEIKKINACKLPLPNCVDGVSGAANIADMWKSHFKDIFNCVGTPNPKLEYLCDPLEDITVQPHEVAKSINCLVDNKAAGLDTLSAEHLKHASHRLTVLLSICFTGFFVHGFLPPDLIAVVLVPIVKDKNAKISAKSNYRPIAIASVLSKIIENIILNRISQYLLTNPNQFGFKAKLGTDMPIYLLKEMIDKYKSSNGNVFMCFLDASKAFDRVNHNLLYSKLLRRGTPPYIVRLLNYWYSSQQMSIRWSGILSESFGTSNGVRQGGILSPFLFNIFMDDMSTELNSCYTGCVVGDTIVNHVMYADDLVVFSPCEEGLAELIEICNKYGCSHDIIFNPLKSAVMIFKNRALQRCTDREFVFTLNRNTIPVVHQIKYLGHWLSDDQRDDLDLLRQCRMLYAQCNLLKYRFHMCTTPVKILLFKTFCYSMYTPSLWWNFRQCAYRKVKVAYNDAFRLLLGVPRYHSASQLFVANYVYTFDALLRHTLFNFITRLSKCSNSLIERIHISDLYWCSRIRHFWHSCLYLNR